MHSMASCSVAAQLCYRGFSPRKLKNSVAATVLPHTLSDPRPSYNALVFQLKGWYGKDDVVAECTEVNGNLFLNDHCSVSGPNSLSEMTAEFRYHIYSKELPWVLEAVLYGDADLFRNHQELMDAVVKSIFPFVLVQVQSYGMLGTSQGCSSGCYFSRVHGKIYVTIAAEYDDWSGQRSREDKWIRICEQENSVTLKSIFQAIFALLL